jgi:hypothetical protein
MKTKTKNVTRYHTAAIVARIGKLSLAEAHLSETRSGSTRMVFEAFDKDRAIWSRLCAMISELDCLQSLASNTVLPAEVLVVCRGRRAEPPEPLRENWSSAAFPIRWIAETSDDLARARNRAAAETSTPLVAFVDELVRVDAHWVATLCRTFRDYPQAMVVTGSLLPNEVSSEASRLLAAGRERMVWRDPLAFRWLCLRPDEPMPRTWCNAHKLGSAANMAYRTSLFSTMRGFDAIAGGAAKESCQHLDLWLRVLDARLGIVREPAAVARDAGVPTMADVKAELRSTAAGISASLVAAAVRRPRHIVSILLAAQWFVRAAIADTPQPTLSR